MFRFKVGHHQVWFLYNVPRGDLILCNLWLSVYMDILLYALIIELNNNNISMDILLYALIIELNNNNYYYILYYYNYYMHSLLN
jgi:hypothetical protein